MAVDTQRIHQASLLPSPSYRIFYEDFESWPPAGWTIVNNGGNCVWESTATINRSNFTGGAGDAASADSDWCGRDTTMDTELRTPPINLLGVSQAWLIFKSDFNDYLNQDHGYVDISTDGGTTWTTLLHYDRQDYRTRIEIIDLTPHVGSANTIIRFRYVAPDWDWWWQVDEVEIYIPLPSFRILYEDFESWPPAGWTIVNNGRDCVWESTATIKRFNFTGGAGDAASADSDRCGTQTTLMDTELRTPPINLFGVSQAWLIFKSDFYDYRNRDHGYVDISTDGGTTWTTLLHYDRQDYRTRIEIIDLTPHVGSANTIIRFRYVAPGWDWWWQVDEVEIYVSYGTFLPLVTRNYRP
jgi:hypothetical protein